MRRLLKSLTLITGAALFVSCTPTDDEILPLPENPTLILDAESVLTPGCGTTTWGDSSGNGNDGTLVGCTGLGWQGTGSLADPYRLNFDGTNLNVTTSLDVDATAMPESTWIAWVRPTRLNHGSEQQILSIDDDAGAFNRSVRLKPSTSQWSLYADPATTWEPANAIVDVWQQVAVVFTATGMKFYKNGTEYSYGGTPTFPTSTNLFLSIGASNNGAADRFAGDLAWVGVYARALTAAEIIAACLAIQGRFSDTIYCE